MQLLALVLSDLGISLVGSVSPDFRRRVEDTFRPSSNTMQMILNHVPETQCHSFAGRVRGGEGRRKI